eukprot:CAMPEP_0183341802 /NCGR_PEP_ID=MMETSP0164_2-20130417/8025_1 /TAXON_ID=221442 /ORGANISM="Coccolithus pelagicus ssp braarudi, Strain PLY182g" /LENGTH=133 /DNA_ID=CAMNT_0025512225 /DNA_START=449 /DNA_END=846 /DNA_ORIENTATION=-
MTTLDQSLTLCVAFLYVGVSQDADKRVLVAAVDLSSPCSAVRVSGGDGEEPLVLRAPRVPARAASFIPEPRHRRERRHDDYARVATLHRERVRLSHMLHQLRSPHDIDVAADDGKTCPPCTETRTHSFTAAIA